VKIYYVSFFNHIFALAVIADFFNQILSSHNASQGQVLAQKALKNLETPSNFICMYCFESVQYCKLMSLVEFPLNKNAFKSQF